MHVREATPADRDWLEAFLEANNSVRIARRGELVRAFDYPMLLAESDDGPAGVLTWIDGGDEAEVLTLHASRQWQGAGSALIEAVVALGRERGWRRLRVVTTNDNVDALRFYQRRGFRLAELRAGAVDEARRTLKPEISAIGDYGIALRDELELEMSLNPAE